MVNEPTDSTSSKSEDSYGRLKCMLCHKEPPNGCIVHGGTGHQVCCVVCARKLKDSHKPCPVCRKKIVKVMMTIFIYRKHLNISNRAQITAGQNNAFEEACDFASTEGQIQAKNGNASTFFIRSGL